MWGKWNSHARLVGMQNGAAAVEKGMLPPQTFKHWVTTWPSNSSEIRNSAGESEFSSGPVGLEVSSPGRCWEEGCTPGSGLLEGGLAGHVNLGGIEKLSKAPRQGEITEGMNESRRGRREGQELCPGPGKAPHVRQDRRASSGPARTGPRWAALRACAVTRY